MGKERTYEEVLDSAKKALEFLTSSYKCLKSMEASRINDNDYLGALECRYRAEGEDAGIHALRAVLNGNERYLDDMLKIYKKDGED